MPRRVDLDEGYFLRWDSDAERMWNVLAAWMARQNYLERTKARRMIRNRLGHDEIGTSYPALDKSDVHPRSGGWTAAGSASPPCARCGYGRKTHDIDGQRRDCDGFIEEG